MKEQEFRVKQGILYYLMKSRKALYHNYEILESSEGVSCLGIWERLIHKEGSASSKALCLEYAWLIPGIAISWGCPQSSIAESNQNSGVEPDHIGLFKDFGFYSEEFSFYIRLGGCLMILKYGVWGWSLMLLRGTLKSSYVKCIIRGPE